MRLERDGLWWVAGGGEVDREWDSLLSDRIADDRDAQNKLRWPILNCRYKLKASLSIWSMSSQMGEGSRGFNTNWLVLFCNSV
jgi:hypothetical protein